MKVSKKLENNILSRNFKQVKHKFISGVVYKVEGDSDVLHFWNSSNYEVKEFDHNDVFNWIHYQIVNGNTDGIIPDNMNEFIFEIEKT